MRITIRFFIIFSLTFALLVSLACPVSPGSTTTVLLKPPTHQEPLQVAHSGRHSVPPLGVLPSSKSSSSSSNARINVSTSSFAPLVDDSLRVGPHVTLNGTWDPLDVPGFPTLKIKQTCLEFSEHLEQEHYGTIYPPVQGGWTPDFNPREAYDYVYLIEGCNTYIEVEYGTWAAGEGSTLWHTGADDIDVFVWPPGVEHTHNNSLTGCCVCTGCNPEVGTFVAPVTGNYTIGLDYYSGVVPMGWRCFVFARSFFQGAIRDGRSVEYDTADIGYNGVFDVRVRRVTGTSLDSDDSWSSFTVSNVTFINYFPPNVTVLSPGETPSNIEGPGLVCINWTSSDPNLDETLQYTVEISNDLGRTWKVIAYTTHTSTVWDPEGAFYGLPPTPYEADGTRIPNFLVRVNVTDGRFLASDVSDNAWIIDHLVAMCCPPYELFIVLIIGTIVIILIAIDVVVFLYRRTKIRKGTTKMYNGVWRGTS